MCALSAGIDSLIPRMGFRTDALHVGRFRGLLPILSLLLKNHLELTFQGSIRLFADDVTLPLWRAASPRFARCRSLHSMMKRKRSKHKTQRRQKKLPTPAGIGQKETHLDLLYPGSLPGTYIGSLTSLRRAKLLNRSITTYQSGYLAILNPYAYLH